MKRLPAPLACLALLPSVLLGLQGPKGLAEDDRPIQNRPIQNRPIQNSSALSVPLLEDAAWDAAALVGLPAEAALREARRATVQVATFNIDPAQGGRVARGTGVVVSRSLDAGSAVVATSAHVVPCDLPCVVKVTFERASGRGRSVRAGVLWRDRNRDLALLSVRIPRKTRSGVIPRRVPELIVGEAVTAIGFPEHLSSARERGAKVVVSGRVIERRERLEADYRALATRELGRFRLDDAIVHSAAVYPGSSGGPLVDSSGALVGIVTGALEVGGCTVDASSSGARCAGLAVGLEPVWAWLEENR